MKPEFGNHTGPKSVRAFYTLTALFIAIGLSLAIYSTSHHLAVKANGTTQFACNINDTFSCDDIALSEYSEIQGVPIAVIGVGYYVSLLFLLFAGKINSSNQTSSFLTLGFLIAAGAIASVVLFAISWFGIGKLCPSCIGVYVVNGSLLSLVLIFRGLFPQSIAWGELKNGLLASLFFFTVIIFAFRLLFPATPHRPSQSQKKLDQAKILEELQKNLTDAQEIPINRSAYSGLGEDFRRGPDDAKLKVIIFADFQCPSCGVAAKNLGIIEKEYGDDIQVVFKNYPLDQSCNPSVHRAVHLVACKAAFLARCVGDRGRFWEFHDFAFENQKVLGYDTLNQWAKKFGLDDKEWEHCAQSKDIQNKVLDDISLGDKLGIDGTPYIFINNVKYSGNIGDLDQFRLYLDGILHR